MATETLPDADSLSGLAAELALEAGRLIEEMSESATAGATTKSTATDFVTAADTAAEELIVEGILGARPDDSILGEEGAAQEGTSQVRWHIDPIDGTTNYVYGIPAFSVSIGAEIDGSMQAGVVFDPSRRRLYRATRGGGAWCNDEPIRCSAKSELSTTLVATGFGYKSDQRRRQGLVLSELLPLVRDIRRFGSAALDLCAVAAGEVDAYYEYGLNPWDMAAGTLIAGEAGAVVTDLAGGAPDHSYLIAASPAVHPSLRGKLDDIESAIGAV